ncbi:hypothetical protein BU16DRAFT_137643 [Lophium mytilinum]|uniref:Uncharacterized protein n=1 Tax=Lophium mytilinum TaxID=390894 RepID=A0A6A6QES2_9PEZI|nr:hypothetical protein BU16DRAFT_137643 [Lophium mytilinum]
MSFKLLKRRLSTPYISNNHHHHYLLLRSALHRFFPVDIFIHRTRTTTHLHQVWQSCVLLPRTPPRSIQVLCTSFCTTQATSHFTRTRLFLLPPTPFFPTTCWKNKARQRLLQRGGRSAYSSRFHVPMLVGPDEDAFKGLYALRGFFLCASWDLLVFVHHLHRGPENDYHIHSSQQTAASTKTAIGCRIASTHMCSSRLSPPAPGRRKRPNTQIDPTPPDVRVNSTTLQKSFFDPLT